MSNNRNVVLYLDKDLVEKTHNLGLNLSKTFENHLKYLITRCSNINQVNNDDFSIKSDRLVGRTGFEPVTFCTSSRCPNRARLPALIELVYLCFGYIATSSFLLCGKYSDSVQQFLSLFS